MQVRGPKFYVIALLCFVLGLHWAILQSVAWVGMVVNYSQDSTLKEAVIKTLSGEYPCQLCNLIVEGKTAEQSQERQLTPKLEYFLEFSSSLIFPQLLRELDAAEAPLPGACSLAPPRQPPRHA